MQPNAPYPQQINPSTPPNITINIDNLNYFRNTASGGSHTLPATFTVPLGLRVKTATTNFTYSNGYPGAANPNTGTGNVSANVSSPVPGAPITLSSSYKNLSSPGGYAIPAGNKQTNTVNYTLSPTNLKLGFIQKGTYTATLNYEAFDAGAAPVATAVQQAPTLTINVADLGELRVNNSDVTVSFSNLGDYKNGVSTSLSNALTISKTTAYDVYVKAAASNLTNGSSTMVGLKYSITPDKVAQILGKPAGTYNTTVTYSFVAP
ncbi:hypothetical protein [Niabella hirudinis]|uniref:hypothetical protein n=1 Tax=Niabella hirudinis TaxID=1285929 RepID=UPI003EB985E3